MCNWASPILVIPKKPNLNVSSTKDNKQFNLRLCIDYHKVNNRTLTARQIKADGRLGKVVANYPLPTIDNILAYFKDFKYFSTLDLQSGYYHIKLTLEAVEKTAFIIDRGKWKCHSLPFGINLGTSAFSYVLGKVLASCCNFALNYLDNIIIFSRIWEEHLEHFEVFKQLKHADLKIKFSKCKFFQIQSPLPWLSGQCGWSSAIAEKLEAIKKLLAPTNVDGLCQFLGITGFYRKFVSFYADITNCLTKLLRKGTKVHWSKQCNNAFNILKEELCTMPSLQYLDPSKPFKLFTDTPNYSYSGILHQAEDREPDQLIPIAYFSGSFY